VQVHVQGACVGFVVVDLLIAITAVYARRQRMRRDQAALSSAELRRYTYSSFSIVWLTRLIIGFCCMRYAVSV
jgi:hypothetical protein